MEEMQNLHNISQEIKIELAKLHWETKTSHIGSEFSCLDLILVLYEKILNINSQNISTSNRDLFILSKGHAAAAWYGVLWKKGFISKEEFLSFCQDGSLFGEHPDSVVNGIDASTGSLGHGLGFGAGYAYSLILKNLPHKVFVLLGDGECQEGSIIEAADFAGRYNLENLIAIVDSNDLQGFDSTQKIQTKDKLAKKFMASGWAVQFINGHNHDDIYECLSKMPLEHDKPSLIIAETIKGKGLKELEGKLESHYRSPRDDEIERFIKELES